MSPVEASAPARPSSPDYAGILRIPAAWDALARGHRGGRRLCNADSCLLRSRFLHALSSAWVFRLFGKQKSFPSARWRKALFMQCGGPRHQYFSKRPGRCAAGLIRNSFPQSTSAGAQGKFPMRRLTRVFRESKPKGCSSGLSSICSLDPAGAFVKMSDSVPGTVSNALR